MSEFKERLWRDLKREHGSKLAQISRPAAGRARYPRPRLLAGTTVGLAAIGTAMVLLLSAASTPAAFAVTGNPDGTVSVVLRRIAGVHGANKKLAALGVRAKFVEVLPGCRAALPPAVVANLKTPGQVLTQAGRQTRIDPRKIPPGRTLTIVSWIKAGTVRTVQLGPAVHAAPECIAGPALRAAWAIAHGCRIQVTALPNTAVGPGPGKPWTATLKGRTVTGNSGATTGKSGPASGAVTVAPTPPRLPRAIRLSHGCPKPGQLPTPPATGNSGSTGNSGTTGNGRK
jgi:hypothetical protein